MFDNGHKINKQLPKTIFLLKTEFHSNRKNQKQFKGPKTSANSCALLISNDVHSDDDDIGDKRIPTQADPKSIQPKLLKSADNQSSLDTNTLHQLQHTDLSIKTLESKLPQRYPLTSFFDTDPKYPYFFAPSSIKPNNETSFEQQKTDFLLRILRTSLIDLSNPKLQRKYPTTRSNKAIRHYFEGFELLEKDEDSDIPSLSTYSEFAINLLTEIQIWLPLKQLSLFFYSAHWLEFSGHY